MSDVRNINLPDTITVEVNIEDEFLVIDINEIRKKLSLNQKIFIEGYDYQKLCDDIIPYKVDEIIESIKEVMVKRLKSKIKTIK